MAYDLEEQESLEQLKAWWEKWGTLTLSVITAGCLAFSAYNGWNWYKRYQGSKATVAYIQLQNAYAVNDKKNMKSIAEGLMKEYPSHVFASLAALMKAADAVGSGDADAARAALSWVIDKGGQPQYDLVARVRLAGVELQAGNAARAKEVLAAAKPTPRQMTAYLDRLGDAELALGNPEAARKAWADALKADAGDGALTALLNLKLEALPKSK
ncbi:MAG: tetratricopeptide repeat protein [Duodenibacillus sp.]|nr:tetratricopeptide repeat protein [Duodenibacillus sp.]